MSKKPPSGSFGFSSIPTSLPPYNQKYHNAIAHGAGGLEHGISVKGPLGIAAMEAYEAGRLHPPPPGHLTDFFGGIPIATAAAPPRAPIRDFSMARYVPPATVANVSHLTGAAPLTVAAAMNVSSPESNAALSAAAAASKPKASGKKPKAAAAAAPGGGGGAGSGSFSNWGGAVSALAATLAASVQAAAIQPTVKDLGDVYGRVIAFFNNTAKGSPDFNYLKQTLTQLPIKSPVHNGIIQSMIKYKE